MKIRDGFISNSSSTSFTCEICKHTDSTEDLLEDIGFVRMPCEHLICIDHINFSADKNLKECALKQFEQTDTYFTRCMNATCKHLNKRYNDVYEKLAAIKSIKKFKTSYREETGFSYVIDQCPICTNISIPEEDINSYIIKEYKLINKNIELAIKQRFSNREDFLKYLKE
jgi:hypothetical protein